ncbi:MAG: hypothetical protein B7733_17750 [Myxococcales bacterium FL481]|nr:MAG: hypothetical protein B7733_17750 [Myxococcales bacterium FL481]
MTRARALAKITGLQQRHSPRRARRIAWAQVGGTSILVGYVLITAGYGLHQQRAGLPAAAVDCDYRAQLLHRRLISFLDRSDNAPSRANDADLQFSTLLRETRDSCSGASPELVDSLDHLESSFKHYQISQQRRAEARTQLLAL